MNILLNVPYSVYENKASKNYTGPLHWSNMLIKAFSKTKHSFTAVVFEKSEKKDKPYFKSKLVKDGRNKWLVLNIWIPTALIIASKAHYTPEARGIIDQVKKAILATKPDAYYVNGFSALTFLLMQAAHELDIPSIATHHGIWLKEYMALRRDLIKTSIKWRKELEKDIVRYATKNIFLSNLSLREFERHLIKVPKNQLEFVRIPYNPIFANKKKPAKNKNGKKLNILMVGRWDAVKNHGAYLELAKEAQRQKLPWTFFSVCNIFPYSHYDNIKEDYLKYIKVIPAMSAAELKKMYAKADIVIIPSHFDVYPGVVTESILQNRPMLISKNVGWVDEFKLHGVEHWIDSFSNPRKTLLKIKQTAKENVPASLYNDVLHHNNPSFVFKKYFELFEEVASTNNPKT